MSIHAALHHETTYRYDKRVTLSPQIIRLRPAPHCRTQILSYSLKVEPKLHFLNWQQDAFSNWLARVVFPEKVREFKVTVDLVADMAIYNPFDFFVEESAEEFPFDYDEASKEDLKPYLRKAPGGPLFDAFMAAIPREKMRTVDFVVGLNARLQQHVKYLIRMEPGVQTPEETLSKASGSCRDSGWLLVQIMRHLGLAARFVSGYLIQLTPDVKSLDGPSGTDHDFTDLHAWCEVFLPGAGWIGLDPTSGLLAGEGHVPLCATPEPSGAAPITGYMSAEGEVKDEFEHVMKISRVFESPRVTKPYNDIQWTEIDTLGAYVDRRLQAHDMRLTMGGEPTFISIDDMQGAEWNVAAVGPTKQKLANTLIRQLRERFAPQATTGGLLTYGQGKWYPGEQLPRWAYSLYWRGDGTPIVRTDLAEGRAPASLDNARLLIHGIAERLEVIPDNILPAYEDAFFYLHRERQLPDNVLPSDNKLKDPEERARISKVFERGLDSPRGFALPVQRWQSRAWISERWQFRQGRMFLIPGDSPIGFRLPLDALPWLPPMTYPHVIPYDPFQSQAPLPPRPDGRRQPYLQSPTSKREEAERDRESKRRERLQKITAEKDQPEPTKRGVYLEGGNVRTALAVEPREGFLCVFLPPVENIEDYLELVAAIEDSAAELDAPVRIEGYPPPADTRLNVLRVTPDPGVIEVNVHPAHNWTELRDNTLVLYEEARLARLGTEKFLIDGRAVGTGGGNHFVVGGATPADSPFLRRPDLLGSLLRYWQNHPGLSYFFSGLFIGATSQHPRIDEAQQSQLYEIELALSQIPPPGKSVPLWQIDRTLRNLLVDLTGNTHRTEISIDKLYSPDGPTGRLGLVEFRCFEMPPHAQMSLTQQLLLRALLAWFWEKPYTQPLVRWGTQLHDKFMLPHYVWRDVCSVLADLRGAGFKFKDEWFAPHFEFRFPRHGSVRYENVELELRHALEPWPVLGEEAALGGVTRFVDSSVERLQVRVTGLTEGRHFVTVAGRRVPLTPTGVEGEAVGGVRYRAWLPASALHPTIGIHTPLVFDLYDAWNKRAVAGCTYHVAHPAGRNYDVFPVNAYEAEARRLARFEPLGHTPGNYWPPQESVNPEFPFTLDLRRPA